MKRHRLRTAFDAWRPSSLIRSLDLALVDPPSLCCDDDELCAACRADSALTGRSAA